MSWEIEVKARLNDPIKVQQQLCARYGEGRHFYKEDEYFQGPTSLRLRHQDGQILATSKVKNFIDGAEVNQEIEFKIEGEEPFKQWISRLNFLKTFAKTKVGTAWKVDNLTIEVVEVTPLGWFIEIEKLLNESNDAQAKVLALQKVNGVLAELNIDATCIEQRTWSEMLGFKSFVPLTKV